MIYLQINYTALIEHRDVTESFSHNITHAMLVELNLNDPFEFKVTLGNWVVGVGLGEEGGGMEDPKNKLYSTQQNSSWIGAPCTYTDLLERRV